MFYLTTWESLIGHRVGVPCHIILKCRCKYSFEKVSFVSGMQHVTITRSAKADGQSRVSGELHHFNMQHTWNTTVTHMATLTFLNTRTQNSRMKLANCPNLLHMLIIKRTKLSILMQRSTLTVVSLFFRNACLQRDNP